MSGEHPEAIEAQQTPSRHFNNFFSSFSQVGNTSYNYYPLDNLTTIHEESIYIFIGSLIFRFEQNIPAAQWLYLPDDVKFQV